MANNVRTRGVGSWMLIGLLVLVGAMLGVMLVSGLSLADAAGRPLGVSAVFVTPTPSATGTPSASPTPAPTGGTDGDTAAAPPAVVTAPPPVFVNLDDHGGDDHSGTSSSDDSGRSGKGGGN